MLKDREQGPTFEPHEIGWIDFETKSETDLKTAGATRYATEADAIVLAWAIGDGPVTVTAVKRFGEALSWRDMPKAFLLHQLRVERGLATWAAFNAGFDRAVWNYATENFPPLQPHHVIDVMAQATAAGLPPDLFAASKICGGAIKQQEGGELLKLFCLPGATATPQSHPDDWAALLSYAGDDIEAMRSVFASTKQLTMSEWKEYWAMEAVNDRGVGVDLKLAEHAAALAAVDRGAANVELIKLTDGAVRTVDSVAAIVNWLLPQLPHAGQLILTRREEEVDENGEVTRPAKRALTRQRVERLLAFCRAAVDDPNVDRGWKAQLQRVERVLQIRRYGGSKTPQKYAKMLAQAVDGKLYGQYVFNGAGQTGRASSRGVQIHNLARDVLPYEHDAIEALLAGVDHAGFAKLGDDTPVSRKLSLLIRPTFIPDDGNVFVWSDWSQIEARVLPWLAGDDPGAEARVQIFRDVDADPSVPDLYTRTAAALSHCAVGDVTKAMRQRGKVAELALGFCGGVGALQSMAAGYGMHLDAAEAKTIVDGWRAANPWAINFAREIWEAMRLAMMPAVYSQQGAVRAGRLHLMYLPDYLEGTLLMILPSLRCLTYRKIRWDDVDVLDDDGEPTGEKSMEMMCSRGYGRVKLWPGIFAENATQATAADVLRGTLVRLEDGGFRPRLHTHDEILCEVNENNAEAFTEALRWQMRRGFDWSDGLPIMSDETVAPYYTKQEM